MPRRPGSSTTSSMSSSTWGRPWTRSASGSTPGSRANERRFIKGQRYNLLSRWENLTLKGKQALKLLFRANRRLNKAYLLKESFGQLWDYNRPGWARRFFEQLEGRLEVATAGALPEVRRGWSRPTGMASRLIAMRRTRCALGFVEGLNNKIRVIQRRAYGYRDEEYFRLKILTCMLPKL